LPGLAATRACGTRQCLAQAGQSSVRKEICPGRTEWHGVVCGLPAGRGGGQGHGSMAAEAAPFPSPPLPAPSPLGCRQRRAVAMAMEGAGERQGAALRRRRIVDQS